jgi:hypothetical protein
MVEQQNTNQENTSEVQDLNLNDQEQTASGKNKSRRGRNDFSEEIRRNASPSTEGFDWDEYEGGRSLSKKDRGDMEKLYEGTFNDVKEKEVIHGTVVGITDKDVVLNIGFKSDGLVPLSEFKYRPDL